MKPESVRTSGWVAWILLVLAGMGMNPPLSLVLACVAALCALFPIIFGSTGWRIAGGAALVLAVMLVVDVYPKAQQHYQDYGNRSKARSSSQSSPESP